jgi:hypothetical protein
MALSPKGEADRPDYPKVIRFFINPDTAVSGTAP